MKEEYKNVKKEFELINYIYYLQYSEDNDDIRVETSDACFMVWEGSSFKVNGEECTSEEFYNLLDMCKGPVSCNNYIFEKKNGKYISVEKIDSREKVYSSIIEF